MDETIDFDLTLLLPTADKQERLKEDCKKIAELLEASATAMFEGQDGLIFHLQFDDAAKFGKFAEYLRTHGLLRVDRMQTKSDKLHRKRPGLSFNQLSDRNLSCQAAKADGGQHFAKTSPRELATTARARGAHGAGA